MQEEEFNDTSLVWPSKEAMEKLPMDWIANASNDDASKTQQQVLLNHVRGSTRIRQASQRIGAALGTITSSFVLCRSVPVLTLEEIGLDWSRNVTYDVCCGIFVGALIVTFIFVVELMLGWIKIIVSQSAPNYMGILVSTL